MRMPERLTRGNEGLREAGLFLVVVGVPLIFTPFSSLSFASPKLVFLLIGASLIAFSRVRVDRRLAVATSIWIAALLIASLFGLDPWWSIVGAEYQNTGVLALAAAAFLMCVGAELEAPLRARIPYWLFWTGAVVGAVAATARFVQFGGPSWRFSWHASTVGHRVFVGAFLAAAALAATGIRRKAYHYVALLAVGSGLAVSAARSAWVGLALGALILLVLRRHQVRPVLTTLIPVLLALAIWTIASSSLPGRSPPEQELGYSPVQRFGELDEGSATQRPPAYRAYLRGWAHNLWLGTGPGTGWYVYLKYATPKELRTAGRGFGDAHNMLLELGATSGLLGILPLLVLGLIALPRLKRAPPDRTWALGATVALAVVLLLQPINIVATPLMFLSAGLALRSTPEYKLIRVSQLLTALLALGLIVASARLLSSSFERYGRIYASESAYRYALAVDPRRLGSALEFAKHRAFDHRTGAPGAGAEARRLVRMAVNQHGWSPRARLAGANVMVLLDDIDAAQRLIDQHLAIFPNDGDALAASASLALRRGDHEQARRLAQQALSIFPDLEVANTVINALTTQKIPNQAETSSGPP